MSTVADALWTELEPRFRAVMKEEITAAATRLSGEDARELRQRLRPTWDINHLSVESRVAANTISNCELGKKPPRGLTIERLARALGCSVTEYQQAAAKSRIKFAGRTNNTETQRR